MMGVGNVKTRPRWGYTLLELLLALALTVVVITTISMAIQSYVVALTRQQAKIERKQVARSVLNMIAKDIRAAIQYKPGDYSGLEAQFAASQPAAPGEEGEEQEDSGLIDEEQVSFRPAMLGSETVIMMDISRLPRLDQYNPMMATAVDRASSPSDVKSLAYFFSSQDMQQDASQIQFNEARAPGGLFRREIDRAVAAYMGDFDMVSNPDEYTKLVASEIAEINFQYFDGEDWQSSWDSEEDGGFPLAIEMIIVIDPARSSMTSQEYSYSGFDQNSMETFRLVVHLPVSEIMPEEEE